MEPKLSVIVPIYNVADYLPRCIESILAQTFTDFELLLVDDGSSDRCPEICDAYAVKDARIKVIHKPNGGVSDARNTGLKETRGEYIAFVDGDDYIVPDAYGHMIREMETYRLDILTGRCNRLLEENKMRTPASKRSFNNIVYQGIDFFCLSVQQGVMRTACWLNIYNRRFLLENQLFFRKGILHEDELWIPQVFLKAHRVKYIDYLFYIYVWRPESIMNVRDKTQNGIDLLSVCYELEPLYAQAGSQQQRKILNDFLLNTFLHAVCIGKLYRTEYKYLLRKKFVRGKAMKVRSKIKAIIFTLDPRIYAKLAESRQ